MADKAITELVEASQVTGTDSFVLEQNGTAKRLTGQTLINYLLKMIDGHGGVSGVSKIETSGLVDTYRMNFADLSTFDFFVTNGRAITSIEETSVNGLTRTYTISFNDGSTDTFTVTNGEKGDKGDTSYIWIKYASQEPTADSHSIGDLPDDWIGIYFGPLSAAPEDWTQYSWFKIKGEKGNTGDPATLVSAAVTYQVSDSGVIIPSGTWGASIPVVAQGKYLWTKIVQTFNTGDPVTAYTVSRMGLDGLGSVVSVCGISPDENGDVPLTAEHVGALPSTGGDMTGPINMNGQTLTGLNAPVGDSDAVNLGTLKASVKKAAPRNLLDNSDFRNPVAQAGLNGLHGTRKYVCDRWISWNEDAIFGDGYMTTGSPYDQFIDPAVIDTSATYTAAIGLADGTVIAYSGNFGSGFGYKVSGIYAGISTSDNVTPFVRIAAGQNVCWAALYEGEYTVDNLPEYQPKGYAAEMMECMRYYQYFNHSILLPANEEILPGFRFAVEMRAVPTVTLKDENDTEGCIELWTSAGLTQGNKVKQIVAATYGIRYMVLETAPTVNARATYKVDACSDL